MDHNSYLSGVNTIQDTMKYVDALDCSIIHPLCHSSIQLHSLFLPQNVEVKDFSNSWANGLALCGILHSYVPEVIIITYFINYIWKEKMCSSSFINRIEFYLPIQVCYPLFKIV